MPDLHTHNEWTWASPDSRRAHRDCEHVGWRCTKCGHDHAKNPPRCHRCEYTVLAPSFARPETSDA